MPFFLEVAMNVRKIHNDESPYVWEYSLTVDDVFGLLENFLNFLQCGVETAPDPEWEMELDDWSTWKNELFGSSLFFAPVHIFVFPVFVRDRTRESHGRCLSICKHQEQRIEVSVGSANLVVPANLWPARQTSSGFGCSSFTQRNSVAC